MLSYDQTDVLRDILKEKYLAVAGVYYVRTKT